MNIKINFIEEKEKNIFNRLAIHPLQSWEWGEFRQSQGNKVIRIGTYEKDQLKQVFQITLHFPQIPHTSQIPYSIGYLPKSSFPSLEVLEKLKSDPIFKVIPIVILTSSKEDPDIKRCYELGANSYIVKPVDNDNFFYTIKELGMFWMVLNQPPK